MIRRRLFLVGLLVGAGAAIALLGGRAQAAAPTPPKVGSAPRTAAGPRPALGTPSTVIYSNLGPGNSYDPVNGWCVDGTAAPCGVFALVAMPFTGNGGRLTQIDLALSHFGGTNAAEIQLVTDSGGLPDTVMKTWFVANMPPTGTCCELTTVTASPSIPVEAGERYWIAVLPVADDTSQVWNWNTTSVTGTWASDLGEGWTPIPTITSAYRVLGCVKLCKV